EQRDGRAVFTFTAEFEDEAALRSLLAGMGYQGEPVLEWVDHTPFHRSYSVSGLEGLWIPRAEEAVRSLTTHEVVSSIRSAVVFSGAEETRFHGEAHHERRLAV